MKAIIFDLYNTLVYTENRLVSPYSSFLNSIGLTKSEIKVWIDNILTNNYSSFDELLNNIKPGYSFNVDKFENQIKEEIQNTFVYDDVYKCLDILSKKYELFLLSNISTIYKESYYNLNLDNYIKTPFFSCDIGYRKPDVGSFKHVLSETGLKSNEVIMIGDSYKSDFLGAQNAGIKAILKNKPLSIIIQEL